MLASPGITRGASILVIPAGDHGCPWGDHDSVIADFELGFSPVPLRPKRESIEWTRHYSPEECVRMMRTLKSLNATYDSLVDRLERAANQLNSVNVGATFEELLTA